MDSKAVQYAYKLLGYRERSVKEIEKRLRLRGFSATSIKEVIEHLQNLGYLNDSSFAKSLRKKAEDIKLLGGFGAKRYLRQMGISREIADDALNGYDELTSARKLLQKKIMSLKNLPEPVQKKRLFGYLRRRGFAAETIRIILDYNHRKQ
jgi:regulatory protein